MKLIFIYLILLSICLYAQEEKQILDELINEYADDEVDYEFINLLNHYYNNKVNINKADYEEILNIPFMTTTLASKLQLLRDSITITNKSILFSLDEDKQTIFKIFPFIEVNQPDGSPIDLTGINFFNSNSASKFTNKLADKTIMNHKLNLGFHNKIFINYHTNYVIPSNNNYHNSFYIYAVETGNIKKLIFGDYSYGFGEGIFFKSKYFNNTSSKESAFLKNDNRNLEPYYNFVNTSFRGLAFDYVINKRNFGLLYSNLEGKIIKGFNFELFNNDNYNLNLLYYNLNNHSDYFSYSYKISNGIFILKGETSFNKDLYSKNSLLTYLDGTNLYHVLSIYYKPINMMYMDKEKGISNIIFSRKDKSNISIYNDVKFTSKDERIIRIKLSGKSEIIEDVFTRITYNFEDHHSKLLANNNSLRSIEFNVYKVFSNKNRSSLSLQFLEKNSAKGYTIEQNNSLMVHENLMVKFSFAFYKIGFSNNLLDYYNYDDYYISKIEGDGLRTNLSLNYKLKYLELFLKYNLNIKKSNTEASENNRLFLQINLKI